MFLSYSTLGFTFFSDFAILWFEPQSKIFLFFLCHIFVWPVALFDPWELHLLWVVNQLAVIMGDELAVIMGDELAVIMGDELGSMSQYFLFFISDVSRCRHFLLRRLTSRMGCCYGSLLLCFRGVFNFRCRLLTGDDRIEPPQFCSFNFQKNYLLDFDLGFLHKVCHWVRIPLHQSLNGVVQGFGLFEKLIDFRSRSSFLNLAPSHFQAVKAMQDFIDGISRCPTKLNIVALRDYLLLFNLDFFIVLFEIVFDLDF